MSHSVRDDALAIWHAAVECVRGDHLISQHLAVDADSLRIGDHVIELAQIERIAVVGGGKAGAGMVEGVESVLSPIAATKQLHGWVNVPENCVQATEWIQLHAARPAGQNLPTEAGVYGTKQILEIVATLGPKDLCICLISGGGSALLPAPVPQITLNDKLTLTESLSAAGANIEELNVVRTQLSCLKGGGLARICQAGFLTSLVISDVLGDPLETIASGPTTTNKSTPQQAIDILKAYDLHADPRVVSVLTYLQNKTNSPTVNHRAATTSHIPIIIGNNATAVEAAGMAAQDRGYRLTTLAAGNSEGEAERIGRQLAEITAHLSKHSDDCCFVWGGEPVVTLVPEETRGKGGRNQQLALAAYLQLLKGHRLDQLAWKKLALLSGGTDGEDGPTDAAGAIVDGTVHHAACSRSLDPTSFLNRNDAYRFFESTQGLLMSGPTHTNVCDLRVVCVRNATH